MRISIIDGEVPCLISKRALKSHGAIIDLQQMVLTFSEMRGASMKLIDVGDADTHVAIRVGRYPKGFPKHEACERAVRKCLDGAETAR